MKAFFRLFTTIFLLGSVLSNAYAYTSPGSPTGFVNDYAQLLSAEQESNLESKLQSYETSNSNEIALVTIPNLGGDTIENFAVKLFEEWGIGKKNQDNGVLVLVAIEERQMRIEVGYGLEPDLTDAQSHWIIENILVPAFREQLYYDGLDAAVDKIMAVLGGTPLVADVATSSETTEEQQISIAWSVAFFFAFINRMVPKSVKIVLSGVVMFLAFLFTGSLILALIAPIVMQILSLFILASGRW